PMVLEPGSSTILETPISFTPSTVLGHYSINYILSQLQEDQDLFNNYAEKDYFIDTHTLARDEVFREDQYFSPGNLADEQQEIGNIFHCWENGRQIHSLSFALGDSTTVGTEIYGVVYNLARDTIFGQTDPYTVNAWDLNAEGESKFVCLPLQEPIITQDTTLYLAMIGHNGGPDERMVMGRSGNPPAQSSLIYYPEVNQLFYLLKTAMVRIHVFQSQFNPGCTDPFAMNYNSVADIDDGCCRYAGCTYPQAENYEPLATFDDGTCIIIGCMDSAASNYDPLATQEGACEYLGCTDSNANNYDPNANVDDGTCQYNEAVMSVSAMSGCAPFTFTVTNQTDTQENSECVINLGDGTE
ncbi:MAG: hypothetical protein HKN32_06910, partial [Flavobacteriales bacterium]|nr:hypothetical protein [Flavobacteriales bacterium]